MFNASIEQKENKGKAEHADFDDKNKKKILENMIQQIRYNRVGSGNAKQTHKKKGLKLSWDATTTRLSSASSERQDIN